MSEAIPILSEGISAAIAPLQDDQLRQLVARILSFEDRPTNMTLMTCVFAEIERTRRMLSLEEQNAGSILQLQLDLAPLVQSLYSLGAIIIKNQTQLKENQQQSDLHTLLRDLHEWYRFVIRASIDTMTDNEELLTHEQELIDIVTHRYASCEGAEEDLCGLFVPFQILEIEQLFGNNGLSKVQQYIKGWEAKNPTKKSLSTLRCA